MRYTAANAATSLKRGERRFIRGCIPLGTVIVATGGHSAYESPFPRAASRCAARGWAGSGTRHRACSQAISTASWNARDVESWKARARMEEDYMRPFAWYASVALLAVSAVPADAQS